MADMSNTSGRPPGDGPPRDEFPPATDAPYLEEGSDIDAAEAPRRAASARFEVESEVGSAALLRGAMDPANQSMGEALRLSYRVLQLVILVLVLLFLVSSVQTVDEDQGGVFTQWGKIKKLDEDENLSPGLKWGKWPYPIGEFILFDVTNRTADVGGAFVQANPRGATLEDQINSATTDRPLNPGPNGDGSLITREGDLVHMRVSARYSIDPATRFVERINDADPARNAAKIVRLALQQATVQTVATVSAQEVVDHVEEIKAAVRQQAQHTLDELECGITLAQVDITDHGLPLSIQRVNGELQSAQFDADQAVLQARRQAEKTLIQTAGSGYRDIITLIEQYEESLDVGDEAASANLLAQINTKLESADVTGEVSSIMSYARAYLTQIESSLGGEVQRFLSLLPAFRENPQLVARKQWLEAFAYVLSRPDVEVMYVPDTLGMAQILLNGSNAVKTLRQQNALKAKQEQVNKLYDLNQPFIKTGADISIGDTGRQLWVDDKGNLVPAGTPGARRRPQDK
jgi:membrane protease subunit HflK